MEAKDKKLIDLPPNIIFTVSLSKNVGFPESNPIEFSMQTLDPLFVKLTSPENKFDESALRKNLNKFLGPGAGPLTQNILDPVKFDLEFYRKVYHESVITALDICIENSVRKLMNVPNLGKQVDNLSGAEDFTGKTRSKIAV